ncbi:MAG: hypothetical protein H0W62_02945 [Chitinophagales bacterium]|nr:hypothetical protein [Chitinophagales bacterium]
MIKKIIVAAGILCFAVSVSVRAQKIYTASAGETIFSLSNMQAGNDDAKPVIRFSPFLNYQQQLHFEYSNNVGFYTGLGIRNAGFINKFGDSLKVKERSYSLGVPVVFTFGNLTNGFNLGIGAEAEFMFAWKRKVFVNDSKTKYSQWFSDNVNFFNPSVLVEVKFHTGQYIRLKYYLRDFLQYQPGGLFLPNNQGILPDYARSSKLFYISLGSVVFKKNLKPRPINDPDIKTNHTLNKNTEGQVRKRS